MLTISTLQPSEPTAQLANYFCRRTAPDFGLHRRTDGSRVLVRSTFDGARRTVERFLMLENFKLKALDRTLFHIDDDRFAETESYRSEQGPNLHAFPIELPGSLVLDQWHVVHPGARVRLGFVGMAQLQWEQKSRSHKVLQLVAQQASVVREQWLAEGVGELALGTHQGSFQQWIEAFRCDAWQPFSTISTTWLNTSRPSLPDWNEATPRRDLF